MNKYDVVSRMTPDDFCNTIIAMIEAGKNFFDEDTLSLISSDEKMTEAYEWAMGLVAYQVAVFFAQRFDTGVESDSVNKELKLDQQMSVEARKKLVEAFYEHLLNAHVYNNRW